MGLDTLVDNSSSTYRYIVMYDKWYYNIPEGTMTKILSSAQDVNPTKHLHWPNFGWLPGVCQVTHAAVPFAQVLSQIWQ